MRPGKLIRMHLPMIRLKSALLALVIGLGVLFPGIGTAADTKLTYEQHMNVVYGEIDGVALVMDVFTPTGPKNGIGIVDIASGAWFSDRGKIRDHMRARVYDIFCGKGYTVFAIRPGSITRFSVPEMIN